MWRGSGEVEAREWQGCGEGVARVWRGCGMCSTTVCLLKSFFSLYTWRRKSSCSNNSPGAVPYKYGQEVRTQQRKH